MAIVQLVVVAIFCFTLVNSQAQLPIRVSPSIIGAGSGPRSCPADNLLQQARMNSSAAARLAIQNTSCGGIGWAQIVNLDMSDSSQQCPSVWTEYTTPMRSCSVPSPGCQGVTYPVPMGTYTRVCGRARGYALGTPDGFVSMTGIDGPYMEGLSITSGTPRMHIWSFAAGHGAEFGAQNVRCPCDNPNSPQAPLPDFVGQNYFCDGDYNGVLWDGQGCTTNCCTFNSPPYFTVTLPAPSSNSIEVRICQNQDRGDEAVNYDQIEIYVQ